MALRRFHYDAAFERYLRRRQIPYIAVDEAKRAIVKNDPGSGPAPSFVSGPIKLKSFDFVVYSRHNDNLLVEVKGRKLGGCGPARNGKRAGYFDNWVTRADIESLLRWERLFGAGFRAAFAFVYWCQAGSNRTPGHEMFQSVNRWYTLVVVTVSDYQTHIKPRSRSWQTVDIPAARFAALAKPMTHLLG